MQVLVRDNNIDQALRVLKKKMQREGVLREMKRRRCYVKPSEQAPREKSEAVRRLRKLARKREPAVSPGSSGDRHDRHDRMFAFAGHHEIVVPTENHIRPY